MGYKLTKSFRCRWLVRAGLAGVVFFLFASSARGWTAAGVSNVDVTVRLADSGMSQVITQARFVVEGGHFHGFDMAEMPGAKLVEEKCLAVLDSGLRHNLRFRRLRNDTCIEKVKRIHPRYK